MDFPFTTDGCSGGLSWLWRNLYRTPPPWEALCIEHDRLYWSGGSREKRREVDLWFWRQLMLHPDVPGLWATAIWLAVRIGGYPLLPLPWRWGYGWRWPRGYSKGQ